jgi:hypothetical protein
LCELVFEVFSDPQPFIYSMPSTTVLIYLAVVLLSVALFAPLPTWQLSTRVQDSHLLIPIPKQPLHEEPLLNASSTLIVTAITGGIDRTSKEQLQQRQGMVVYHETKKKLPFPRHDINERLRSKYFKMSTHWLHPNFAVYIWVDGKFTIDAEELRSWLVEELGSADCAFFKHPRRSSIVQEYKFVVNRSASGDKYMKVRYDNEPMKAQVDAYIAEGFPTEERMLLSGGLFVRRNSPRVNAAFDHWFIENVKWTIQDQLSLPYILWKHNLTYKMINGNVRSGPHHKCNGHVQLK